MALRKMRFSDSFISNHLFSNVTERYTGLVWKAAEMNDIMALKFANALYFIQLASQHIDRTRYINYVIDNLLQVRVSTKGQV
jgi:hypothetical protein